ncbi:MAG: hypothetical protein ACRETL_12660, partial [Gammaproteobacteria bacterium]
MLQKAKDNFNANTQGAQPGDGAIKGFIENIGQGGGEFVRAVAHPIDSISSTIHSLAHPLDAAHAEVDALYADPSRFIGNTIGQLGTGGIAGEVAAPVAEAAATFAPKIAGRAILLGKTPEAAYESALKPSVTLSPAERTSVVNTGLKNSIPISTSGVEKIGELIDNYNKDIQNTVNSAGPNRPIDPNQVATRADAAKAKFYNQVNAQGDVNAIDASKQQFLAEQGAKSGTPAKPPQPTGLLDAQGNPIMSTGTPAQPATPAPPMSASDAQAMKQGTYQVLRGKFGEQGSAAVEAQKNLARGLKEEIANQFPEIGNLNAQESKLLDLQPVLERAVARNSNHQLIGIGTPVAGAAVKAVTGSGGAAAAASVLKSVLDNPMVKSRLAIAVSKGARIPYADALGRVGAYSTALSAASPANPGDGQPLEMTQPVPEENLANQGYGAMAALPAPVARIARALNPTVTQGPARPDDAGGQGAVANVIQGAGNNNIEINDSASFKRYANQTMGHEITHLWQNSLPPSIQANIP